MFAEWQRRTIDERLLLIVKDGEDKEKWSVVVDHCVLFLLLFAHYNNNASSLSTSTGESAEVGLEESSSGVATSGGAATFDKELLLSANRSGVGVVDGGD